MHYKIPDFEHHRGRHCGSGALANLMRYERHPLPEPLIIGLGSALAFGYIEVPGASPSRMLLPRSPSLEIDFCENAGLTCRVEYSRDPERAWQGVRDRVASGKPVMINCDIYSLEYFPSKTHFAGHKVLVVGFDEEKRIALISDTEFDEIQHEPLDSLATARASGFPPAGASGSPWFEIDVPGTLRPLPEAMTRAIRRQAERMLDTPNGFGVDAFDKAAAGMLRWGEAEDWSWCARFGYQVIERRGTGGGAFRKMYAEFLDRAEQEIPALGDARLAAQMHEIADAWTQLAGELRRLSEQELPPDFGKAAGMLEAIGDREKDYYRAALAAVGAQQ